MNAISRKPLLLLAALASIAVAAACLSLLVGSAPIAPARLWSALLGRGDMVADIILFDLRLPRTLLSLAIGAMLGLAGATLQGYLRNPLAEPSVLGISNMAALGSVLAIYFGLANAHPLALPFIAVTAAIIGLAGLFLLIGRSARALTLILSGMALGALAGAGISLALNLSPNPFAAMEIANWLLGSIENRSADHLWLALPCIAVGGALLLTSGRALDALALGEATADSLGIHPGRLRSKVLLGTAIGIGGAVAVSGTIGFIGLIVPHLVRPLTDRLPSSLLLPSALGGGALLTLADVGVHAASGTNELKLGVVTAFIGVPIFIAQIARQRSSS